MYLIIY